MKKKPMTLQESTSKAGKASMAKRTAKQRSEFARKAALIRHARRRNPRDEFGRFRVKVK